MSTRPPLLAVPNISEGRDRALVARIAGEHPGARLLDVHTDPDHNRSVLTYAGPADGLVDACVQMTARAVASLDIREHAGVHPRLGVVDVLPFVPYGASMEVALEAAREAARRIDEELGVPVELYGELGTDLPAVRRAGATGHASAGVVCVGVRGPLIAFNVDLRGPLEVARRIAVAVREPGRIRALAFPLESRGLVQVSMNLIDPMRTGPLSAFGRVADLAHEAEVDVVGAEVVGLVPDELLIELEGLPLVRPAQGVAEALGR